MMNENTVYWGMEEKALRLHLNSIEAIKEMTFSVQDIEAISIKDINKKEESIMSLNGDTAEIKIVGVLSRTGPSWIERFFGITGTAYGDIIKSVNEVADNPAIKKIILKMNTPGGIMSGVDETWQAIKSAANKKEVIAENHGLMASAGYYLASAASRIVATSPISLTGSIGVMVAVWDMTDALKERGIKQIKIISKNAPDKNPDLNTKEGIDVIQKEIDALERVFIDRIAQGRNLDNKYVSENFGQGALLVAQDPDREKPDAINIKMIDSLISNNPLDEKNDDEDYHNGEIYTGTPPFKEYDIVDKPWNADAAKKRVREKTGSTEKPSKEYKNAFFWFDSKNIENFGSYKLPFVDVVDGRLVAIRSGIFAADRAMGGARTGKPPDIPAKDRPVVQNHIDRYKSKIEKMDKKKKEKGMASLHELMEQDPALRAEVELREKELEAKIRNSESQTINNRIKKAIVFVGNAEYPKAVSEYAKKVLLGEASVDGLDAVVASVDAVKEEKASAAAAQEGKTQIETPPATPAGAQDISNDGKIRTQADIKSFAAAIKPSI